MATLISSASMWEQKRSMDRKSAFLIRYSLAYGERASNVTLTTNQLSRRYTAHKSTRGKIRAEAKLDGASIDGTVEYRT